MEFQACICCGEPVFPGRVFSRHPGVCPSCSSLLDGMQEQGPQALPKTRAEVSPPLVLITKPDPGKAGRYEGWGLND